jgi:flagellar motor protein MotB
VLRDLQYYYRPTDTGEYMLDAGLTHVRLKQLQSMAEAKRSQSDIERLVARSFLKKEDDLRRKHPRQLDPRHPTPYVPRASLEQAYASSIVSSTSRTSRRSGRSTELGHSEDDGFETSQTSQADPNENCSSLNGDCTPRKSCSVAQRSGKSTNPFHMRIQDGGSISSNNPWAKRSFWHGDSCSGR